MHRDVLDQAAADVDDAHRIQLAAWEASPPKPSAFAAKGQVPSEAPIDEDLEPPEGITRIRMSEVVDPPPHDRVYHRGEFLGLQRGTFRREVFQPVTDPLLGVLRGRDIDR